MQGMVVSKTNNEARNIAFITATNSLCSVALNEAVRQPTSTAVCISPSTQRRDNALLPSLTAQLVTISGQFNQSGPKLAQKDAHRTYI